MKKKEEDILNAALMLMVAKGFHGASTASIAHKAGVSNGILFHYFKSKDALIQKLHQLVQQEQSDYIAKDLISGGDTRDLIQQVWRQSIDWAINNSEKNHFLKMYQYSPFRKKQKNETDVFKAMFLEMVEKGIQKKKLRYMPGEFIYELTLASANGMVDYFKDNTVKYRTPEFMKQAFDSFFSGIRA